MDLFDYMRENQLKQEAPLASRLRPRTLDETRDKKDILGKGQAALPGDSGGQAELSDFLWTAWHR